MRSEPHEQKDAKYKKKEMIKLVKVKLWNETWVDVCIFWRSEKESK